MKTKRRPPTPELDARLALTEARVLSLQLTRDELAAELDAARSLAVLALACALAAVMLLGRRQSPPS